MKKIIGISFLVLTAALYSCNNEKVDTVTFDEQLSEKSAEIVGAEVQIEATTTAAAYEVEFFANAETTLTRWWKVGKKFGWRNASKTRYHNQCPDVSVSGEDYPKTITLNYGDSTVLRNGKVLSGIIEILITAPRNTQDYTRTITYTNFCRDSVCLTGTSIVEVDKVDDMFRKFTSSMVFTLADGTEITRESERVWQWIAGIDTEEDQTDDVITISGKAQATMVLEDNTNATYVKEITTPLKRLGDCKYIVEGVVTITLNGELICTMDYGDGTCDEFATMTNADGISDVDLSERKQKSKKNQNGNQGGNGNG